MRPEIQKTHYDDLKTMIERANENNEYEVECVFAPSVGINSESFTRVRRYLSRMEQFKQVRNEDTLDTSMLGTDYRISFSGLHNMTEFCNRGALPTNFEILEKVRDEETPPIRLTEYNIYFKSRLERPKQPEDIPDFFRAFAAAQKFFRTKKRFSFLHESGHIRVDLTVVKASAQPARTMPASGVVKAVERFEIEAEYLNSAGGDPKQVIEEFFEVFEQIQQVIEDTDHLLTNSQKRAILCAYLFMTNRPVVENCDRDASKLIRERVMARPKSHFLSYQPVTLEQQNILPPELGRLSILKDYTVTEKADGERMLLFVDGNYDIYTIDPTLTVRSMGVKHQTHKNTLLDGEFVRKSKFNTVLNTYMAFDVYFLDGNDVRNSPLIPDRFDAIKGFVQEMPKRSPFVVKAKQYLHEGDIFELAKKVYEKDYDYHIDGLIFTPAKLGVGTYYKGEKAAENTFGGMWPSVLKWKPPEENSIDMLVTYGKEQFVPGLGRCVVADLQVAYHAGAYATIDPYTVLTGKELVQNARIVPKSFANTHLLLRDGDSKPRTTLGEIVYNNVIVEFSYDLSVGEQRAWVPYRLRTDKTNLYHRTRGNIANTANSYNTAMNVWRSIHMPVTRAMIVGDETLNEADVLRNDVYYSRNVSRARILSKPMLEFHNKGVKSRLFDLFKNKNYSLIDMASGKAGDMRKWVQARYQRVLGVDSNLDNLLNSKDGAYKRLYQLNQHADHRTDILFVQKDISESWEDTSSIENEQMRDVYVTLSSKKVVSKSKAVRDSLSKFKNALNEGFDVVSCQFAIHYMFRSDVALDTFCANVDQVLKKGGYFIGTCLNGAYVDALLGERERVEGRANDNTLWMVQKKYAGRAEEGRTGQTIGVYIESINQVLDEYLVDFELLKERLAPYGIREMDKEDLQKLGIERSIGDFRDWHIDERFPLSTTLKEYSFLNSWFVFKKY